ncbi:MAG: permease [Phycisphaerae bacterium]|nr:permease [Phycisphaerae bacterium]
MPRPPTFDILGIGTVAVDDLLHVDKYPPPDEKAPVRGRSRGLGGQTATALAAAARLGARCVYAGVLGVDDLSSAARRGLEAAGVDCTHVLRCDDARPIHSVIVVARQGRTRNIFYDLGGTRPLPHEAIGQSLVTGAKVLLIDQLGSDGMILAANLARARGIPVVADMEWPDEPCADELMSLVDHLIVPHRFAEAITGLTDPARAAWQLHVRHPRECTVVTCGRAGCHYLAGPNPSSVRHQPAIDLNCVETTGCGDIFHGTYAAALVWGRDGRDRIAFATAAAALYASRPNGWDHLPTRREVDAMVALAEGAS